MISVQEAKAIINKHIFQLDSETILLSDSSGRIIDHDVIAAFPSPRFDNSAMDGFAMRHEDTVNSPSKLKIIGTIQAAGQEDNITIKQGQAVRIMTGAPLPEGADSILQIELTSVDGDEVTLSQPSMKHFIRKRGENLTKGQIALNAGTYLTPSRVGLCATMGHPSIPVVKKLKVAIICTGDELKQPGSKLNRGEIYESNSFGLSGLVNWLGQEPIRLHHTDVQSHISPEDLIKLPQLWEDSPNHQQSLFYEESVLQ